MKYHRTYLAYVDTVGYCTAPLLVQAATAWLWVACARAENSGLFLGAKAWGDKQWQALTNGQLKRRHIEQVVDARLAAWEGDHLRVHGYDLAGQEAYERDRERFTAHRERRTGGDGSGGTGRGGLDGAGDGTPPGGRTRSAPGAHPDTPRSLQAPSDMIGLDQIKSDMTRAAAPSGDGADANPRHPGGATSTPDVENPQPGPRTTITKPLAAIRAAVAAGDTLALLRANGCRIPGKEAEWIAAAAGMCVATLGTILAWADGLDAPIVFPSGLSQARANWRELPRDRRQAIARQHAETLGTSALFDTQESTTP